MNKEVHYEGWLIKSPPTKRIWRARWRRRWFTLKQGEIPEQFCLEYYTDRNCRKLKGVIDLDQCEQVDCGLRLENRKQKFQFMFDIKTPKRTYYLAADTEADMRDWVNCICQVCHLHGTKQSNEMQDANRTQNNVAASNNTTTTSLNSTIAATSSGVGLGGSRHTSFSSDILRRPITATPAGNSIGVVNRQPQSNSQNNSDCAYVNTEYSNRETLLCDMHFNLQQQYVAAAASIFTTTSPTKAATPITTQQQMPSSPGGTGIVSTAIYLNSPIFGAQQIQNESAAAAAARSAVNSNGVVRKIPENLVLNNTPLPETLQQTVQPSPALSTASGPYIPISECFSGSPKFSVDNNNPATPLNNLDPKFYDTPRSHNNIGLNLTNDQSYSPKITNCSSQQMSTAKNRSHRSDSDSESVFTDDDEWTHPLPLRENVDRSTRPSDSSVENESFVLTYSQRFSKLPDDAGGKEQNYGVLIAVDPQSKLAKVLKNKNNLILDFKENEKITRDIPQLSDTENTSPAIGPRDATSVVEESYDIPRSHNLPYYNMGLFFEKVTTSPETNPIAASTPNLMIGHESGSVQGSPTSVRTLPRPHCYTNAAPNKVEGNVFRYDFMEQADLPPVNRNLKPKVNVEDKPPEELPAKPPSAASVQQNSPYMIENLANKLQTYMSTNIQSPGAFTGESSPPSLKPPSVDRKLKPNAYKLSTPIVSMTLGTRRSTGAPLWKVLPNDGENIMETRTLPRQPRPNFPAAGVVGHIGAVASATGRNTVIQHQRTASAAAAMLTTTHQTGLQLPAKNEHKLQYFDLDVANPPAINRQSMSVGNLNATGNSRLALGISADPSARAPMKSSIVYNSVDFVKTEAFKRIREERKKESEGANNGGGGTK